MKTFWMVTLALGALSSPGVALAQEAEAIEDPFFRFSGLAAIYSDYRFRGISQTDKDFTPQASIRVDTKPGFYVATWASGVDDDLYAGADVEIDIYGGWAGNINGWKPDVGLLGYVYPGANIGVDYFEIYGSLGRDIGPVSALVGVNYAPDQGNLVSDSTYVYGQLGVGIPGTPISLQGRIGYEDGAFADEKIDWLIGASVTLPKTPLTFGVQYIDTDRNFRLGDAGVVFNVTATF